MVATPYEHDLRVCGAYLRMCIAEKSKVGFEKFSTQMRTLIKGALEDGELNLAADYHLFLQMQELEGRAIDRGLVRVADDGKELDNERFALIRRMVESTLSGDESEYEKTETLYRVMFPNAVSGEYMIEVDMCRQSCLGAFNMPSMREAYVRDAQKRLGKIEGMHANKT